MIFYCYGCDNILNGNFQVNSNGSSIITVCCQICSSLHKFDLKASKLFYFRGFVDGFAIELFALPIFDIIDLYIFNGNTDLHFDFIPEKLKINYLRGDYLHDFN